MCAMRTSNAKPAPAEVCSLPPTAAVELRGDDARAFLQGQLTSDLRQVDPRSSQLSAWCNPQGRVITTLRVIDTGESFLLLLPADQAQHVTDRLRRFVLRAHVTIALRAASLPGIGLSGATALGRLDEAGLPVPDKIDGVAADRAAWVVRVAGVDERYEVYARIGPDQSPAERLGLVPRGDSGWRLGNIRAGLPVVHAANREQFLPQMLNLDVLAAVSFSKGCYPGQEIVARTQNLGRVKRRMLRFAGRSVPEAGSPIRAGSEDAGAVIEAARTPERVELLAVIRLDCATSALTATGDALPLDRLELPYPLPPADTSGRGHR
jgi:hypothetical protein